jgi:hypothetical protein
MIYGGPVESLAQAREMATTYPHDYAIRSESVELQGSSKPGNLWVTYVAVLSNGDTYRAQFGTQPVPASRVGALTRELSDVLS